LKIGIDYTSAAHQGAGIGRLTRCIVNALAEIDHDNQYRLLIRGRDLHYAPLAPDTANAASGIHNGNFREVRTWVNERWWNRIWFRLRIPLPVEWLVGPLDLFHSPDFTLPPVRRRTRTIVTVHDLSFLHLSYCFEPPLLAYLRANVPQAVQRADWVIADSQNTRQDVIELLRVPAEKVSVIYPGVEARFRPGYDRQTLERVRTRYGLPSRFILSVGTVQPRKNYVRLIEAFAMLGVPDLGLVIVGGLGWLYQDVFAAIHRLDLEERVIVTGYVDDADLPAVYNLAQIFALPSLYEGFGIPPLEAMACGLPVVVADNSSLPEVVGDAGVLVNASDTAALADHLARLLHDPAFRQELGQRGLARAQGFTWHQAAQSLLATYRQVSAM
jgi:glycosyltransferase involved in cell wall biosynthesis